MGTSSERVSKEFRLKKSQHVQWDNLSKESVNTAFEKSRLFPMRPPEHCDTDGLSVESPLTSKNVWNVSCTLTKGHKDSLLHDSMPFLCSSTKRLQESSGESTGEKTYSSFTDADISASTDGTQRTRDEGYSTMSSDLQPDSAADTTVSEQDDHSVTYIVSENGLRCSDDSVTECLDGSMSSSSDSGFGPLHYMTRNPTRRRLVNSTVDDEDSCDSHKESDCSPSNDHALLHSLGPLREVIDAQHTEVEPEPLKHTSEKSDKHMTITFSENFDLSSSAASKISPLHVCHNISCKDLGCGNETHTLSNDAENYADSINRTKLTSTVSNQQSICKVQLSNTKNLNLFETFAESSRGNQHSKRKHALPKDAWTTTEGDDLSLYFAESLDTGHCSQDDNVIETAEKATLTEPEEVIWREKALAHFIDESIWSLYSSESDTQLRQFSETFHSQNSSEDFPRDRCLIPRSETNPCIVLSRELGSSQYYLCGVNDKGTNSEDDGHRHQPLKVSCTLKGPVGGEISNAYFSSHGLERVASDTVLYLKDAFRELETSMRPGLKSAKNITNQNIPLFDRISTACLNIPESLPSPMDDGNQHEKFLLKTPKCEPFSKTNSLWRRATSQSHSSSVSSLQSSVSCHLVSDEMDDEEVQPASRKGSQDPDLSSDADNENLEHRDFVERWLQKEMADNKYSENKILKSKWQKDFSPRTVITSAEEQDSSRTNGASEIAAGDSSPPSVVPLRSDEMESSFPERLPSERDLPSHSVSQRLPMTPYSPESCCMGAVSAMYIDACASYTKRKSSPVQFITSPEHPSSPSSIVCPLLFTCESVDDETASLCDSNEIVQTAEFEEGLCKSLEPEVKEFNSDFYRLCSVGSLRSLDSFALPGQEIFLKKYAASPKFTKTGTRSSVEQLQKSPISSQRTSVNNQCISKLPGRSQPVRPTSFASPLVCNGRQFSCFGKDLETARSDKKIGPNIISSTCNGDTNSRYNCEQKSKCSPRFDDSLPLNRTYILKRQVSETEVKTNKKALVAAVKPCTYGEESIPAHSTDRSYSESPSCRTKKCFGNNGNSSPVKLSLHGISSSPRNDAVSRRRRERQNARQKLKEGRGTAWVHLQTSGDIADPKTRASMLDSVFATTSSSGSSSTDEDDEALVIHNNSQLQRICREKREKVKACGKDDFLALSPRIRTSILNRQGLYYRYGDQEKEAIACFDFLEEIPSTASERGSVELFQKRMICDPGPQQCNCESASKGQITAATRAAASQSSLSRSSQFSSFNSRLRLPGLWNKPLSHNMSSSTLNSQDCELLDHISLSDSCAESYSSTPDSFEEAS